MQAVTEEGAVHNQRAVHNQGAPALCERRPDMSLHRDKELQEMGRLVAKLAKLNINKWIALVNLNLNKLETSQLAQSLGKAQSGIATPFLEADG